MSAYAPKIETEPKLTNAEVGTTLNDVMVEVEIKSKTMETEIGVGGTNKVTTVRTKTLERDYHITYGVSPWPERLQPTPEDCKAVERLLAAEHGEVIPPKDIADIPLPSRDVAGCGEVQYILEALIRTLLSANTTMENANTVIKNFCGRFPTIESGPAKGSIDWNVVRHADIEEISKTIKKGGNQNKKAKAMKMILDMVYEENERKREELATNGSLEYPPELSKGSIRMAHLSEETLRDHQEVLTLDYMHAMSSKEAMERFIQFPEIGVKTASCILLFCMQRQSFAVDTHVHRICRWLGWVPPENDDEDKTFAHCDVRVPPELKYALHQLMIAHGQDCGKCKKRVKEGSKVWENSGRECPLDHLMKKGKNEVRTLNGVQKQKPKEASSGNDKGKHKSEVDNSGNEGIPSPTKKRKTKARLSTIEAPINAAIAPETDNATQILQNTVTVKPVKDAKFHADKVGAHKHSTSVKKEEDDDDLDFLPSKHRKSSHETSSVTTRPVRRSTRKVSAVALAQNPGVAPAQ